MTKEPSSDQPVDGSRKKPDLLHRKDFAIRVAKALSKAPPESSLVASLEGPWGSGKTSVFEMICRHYEGVKDGSGPVIIRFNPWEFSGLQNLAREFLIQFGTALQISDKGKMLAKAGDELVRYSTLFDFVKFLPGAEPWASICKSLFSTAGEASVKIGDLKSLNIDSQKERVIEALRKTKKDFLVVVDDVDRLNPEETYSILQLVKAVSNFPNVVYLLGYDRGRVEASLASLQIPDAKSFLEKIVQLRIPLPRISADDARGFLDLSLRGFGESLAESHFPDERTRWSNFAFKYLIPLLDKPRDYVRLANRLRFNYGLVEGELAFSDYCALEMLAVIEPSLYDHIKDNPKYYIGVDPQDILDYDKDTKHFRAERERKLEEVIDTSRRKKLTQLLTNMFPYAMNDSTHGNNSHNEPSRSSGRVSNPDNFELAFYYSRPANLVSLGDLRLIWGSPDERWKVMHRLGKKETGARFLSLVDELVCNPREREGVQEWDLPADLIGFLADYSRFVDLEGLPDQLGGMFDREYRQYVHRLIFWIIKRTEKDKRFEFAKDVCSRVDLMPIATFIVSHERWGKNQRKSKQSSDDYEIIFSDSELESLEILWKSSFEMALTTEGFCRSRLIESSVSCAVLCECEFLIEEALTRDQLKDDWRANLLVGLLGRGSVNGRHYLVADTKWALQRIDPSKLRAFADLLPSSILIRGACVEAVKRCYEQPGKRFFADSGEPYQ